MDLVFSIDDCANSLGIVFHTIVYIQVLHILTKNLESLCTISFSVPGNQAAKICLKAN